MGQHPTYNKGGGPRTETTPNSTIATAGDLWSCYISHYIARSVPKNKVTLSTAWAVNCSQLFTCNHSLLTSVEFTIFRVDLEILGSSAHPGPSSNSVKIKMDPGAAIATSVGIPMTPQHGLEDHASSDMT